VYLFYDVIKYINCGICINELFLGHKNNDVDAANAMNTPLIKTNVGIGLCIWYNVRDHARDTIILLNSVPYTKNYIKSIS